MSGTPSEPRPKRPRRRAVLWTIVLAAVALTAGTLWPQWFGRAGLAADETVVWFPGLGRLAADGKHWRIDVHGWVFEPEADDTVRRAAVAGLRDSLGVAAGSQTTIFERRLRWFLVDSQRGKELRVNVAGLRFQLPPSGANGHLNGEVQLPAGLVGARRLLPMMALGADGQPLRGDVHLLDATGLSVISDIDDTIKVSDVTDKKKLMRRTFLEEFVAVPGMAELYQGWVETHHVQLHFVSGSPWQLYPELAAFTARAGFPPATFGLRSVRFKDHTAFELVRDPVAYKLGKITPLFEAFPERRFVLVGDSGEKDPEVYGEVARRYRKQVVRVFIRDVTGEAATAARYAAAFRGFPAERWVVFKTPASLKLPE